MQRYGIDVDGDGPRAGVERAFGFEGVDGGEQGGGRRKGQLEVEAVLIADAGDGRGLGAEEIDGDTGALDRLSNGLGETGSGFLRTGHERIGNDDSDHPGPRRELRLTAFFQFIIGEGFVIAGDGVADGRGVGGEGLDDDIAADVAAATSTGDLEDELKGAFLGAEVVQRQGGIGADDADEGDKGKIEPFGDHLGADEDVEFAIFEGGKDIGVVGGAFHRVGVHSADAGGGEFFL